MVAKITPLMQCVRHLLAICGPFLVYIFQAFYFYFFLFSVVILLLAKSPNHLKKQSKNLRFISRFEISKRFVVMVGRNYGIWILDCEP